MITLEQAVDYHVMVDIETLGTDSNAFITSIGAIGFIPGDPAPRATKYWDFDPWESQAGAVVDGATVVWRQGQNEESKRSLRKTKEEYSRLDIALDELREFIGDAQVWANSPNFDLTIIENAARRLGQKPVTKFYKHRDVRTAKMVLESLRGKNIKYNNSHHPLDDCRNQIHFVVEPLLLELYGRDTSSYSGEGRPGSSEPAGG